MFRHRSRRSRAGWLFVGTFGGSVAVVVGTSLYFIHTQIGISAREVEAYLRGLPLMYMYWLISTIRIPFLSDAMDIVRAIGLDNVPIRDREAFHRAMVAVQAFLCLMPVNIILAMYLGVAWLTRSRGISRSKP